MAGITQNKQTPSFHCDAQVRTGTKKRSAKPS